LEDELLRCLETNQIEKVRKQARSNREGELPSSWLRFFRKTQKFLEKTHLKQRKDLLKHDKHRSDVYRRMGLDPCLELTES
jgi:preprotein translocase subunit SecA